MISSVDAAIRSRSAPRRELRDARLRLVALRGEDAKDAAGICRTNLEFVTEKFDAMAAETA